MAIVDAIGTTETRTSAMTGEIVLIDQQDAAIARSLLGRHDFRRLLSVRMFGQFADGIFQASLAGTILFKRLAPKSGHKGSRVKVTADLERHV